MVQVQAGTPSARRITVDPDTMEVTWQDDHIWSGDEARQIWSEHVTVTGNLGYGQWSCVITLPYGSTFFYDHGVDVPENDEESTVSQEQGDTLNAGKLAPQFRRIPGKFTAYINDDGTHSVINTQTCDVVQTFPANDYFASDYLASALNAQDER